jgi:hypothetical protein
VTQCTFSELTMVRHPGTVRDLDDAVHPHSSSALSNAFPSPASSLTAHGALAINPWTPRGTTPTTVASKKRPRLKGRYQTAR